MLDEEGNASDWIELVNRSSAAVDLAGLHVDGLPGAAGEVGLRVDEAGRRASI